MNSVVILTGYVKVKRLEPFGLFPIDVNLAVVRIGRTVGIGEDVNPKAGDGISWWCGSLGGHDFSFP